MARHLNTGVKYGSYEKTHGPPHNHFNPIYDPIEHNEYLLGKGVDIDALKSIHAKGGVAPV